jgi:hypothetical protein
MTGNAKMPDRIEELPDRREHMRKIMLIRKLEHPQYAPDDPTRTADPQSYAPDRHLRELYVPGRRSGG